MPLKTSDNTSFAHQTSITFELLHWRTRSRSESSLTSSATFFSLDHRMFIVLRKTLTRRVQTKENAAKSLVSSCSDWWTAPTVLRKTVKHRLIWEIDNFPWAYFKSKQMVLADCLIVMEVKILHLSTRYIRVFFCFEWSWMSIHPCEWAVRD